MRRIRIKRKQVVQLLNGRINLKLEQTEYIIDTVNDGEDLIAVVVASKGDELRYEKRKKELEDAEARRKIADQLRRAASQAQTKREPSFDENRM